MKRIGVDMFRHKETILGCFILEHSVQYSRNNRWRKDVMTSNSDSPQFQLHIKKKKLGPHSFITKEIVLWQQPR